MLGKEKSPLVREHQTDYKDFTLANSIAYQSEQEKLAVTKEPSPKPVLIDCFIGSISAFRRRIKENLNMKKGEQAYGYRNYSHKGAGIS